MYLEDMRIGAEINVPEVSITKDEMIAFSKKYDPFPLHIDEEYARKTRFGGLIAPGMMTFLVVWAKFVENDLFGDELVAGKSSSIEWFKPVYPGDTLRAVVHISRITRRNAHNGIVETIMDVYNQNGECVLTNATETVVKCREA